MPASDLALKGWRLVWRRSKKRVTKDVCKRDKHAALAIYGYYGARWRIEEGFRVLKHPTATRPIYH